MNQEPLFFDDWADALRHVVAALGGPKQVGAALRPEMKPDHAGRWLMDCLNSDRREYLSPDHLLHLLALGRKAGVHAGMSYMAESCGYQALPIEPADEAAELMRQFIASAKAMEHIAGRIEILGMGNPLRAVK